MPLVGRAAIDLLFDIVERPDPLKCFLGDLRLRGFPDVVEVTPQMRPTCRLAELGRGVRTGLIEFLEPAIGVRLQDALAGFQVALRMLAFPVGREVIDRGRRRGTGPGSLIAHIGPDPAFLDALAQFALSFRRIENPDRGIVRVQ